MTPTDLETLRERISQYQQCKFIVGARAADAVFEEALTAMLAERDALREENKNLRKMPLPPAHCKHEPEYYVDQTTQGYCARCGTRFGYREDATFGPMGQAVVDTSQSILNPTLKGERG